MISYLSLGSNIHPRHHYLSEAVRLLEENGVCVEARSADFFSMPWGYASCHEYINCCLRVRTSLAPLAFLDLTQEIERRLGRTIKNCYADRTIDIDLVLCFADDGSPIEVQTDCLTLPHPLWQQRDFVKIPLSEILDRELH